MLFQRLRRLQAFERANLSYLKSTLDSMVITEVGFSEMQGHPLTVKQLILLKLGSPSTVRRHLDRLVALGLLHKRRANHDGRVFQLEADPAVRKTYAKYCKLISRL